MRLWLTVASFATIDAFVLKRSSLVIPGFLGTPAGMTTISAPTRESFSCSSPVNQKCAMLKGYIKWSRLKKRMIQ